MGAFLLLNLNFLDLSKNDKTYLEREPWKIYVKKNNLSASNILAFGSA